MQKNYVIDTNCAIDDPSILDVLQNGEENQVYIPWTVIQELDHLKTQAKKRHKVYEVIRNIEVSNNNVHILKNKALNITGFGADDILLEEIECSGIEDPILVSNDIMLRIKAKQRNIKAEQYKMLVPFKSESQKYTGFINKDKEDLVNNCFYWNEGKMFFHSQNGDKLIDYENSPWQVVPKTQYQNAAMELMLNDNINLVSIQSSAGFGKSYISLATALELILIKKSYKKIYVIKPNIEIGESFGFLPGNLESKMDPYFRNLHNLLLKLHEKREANKIFKKEYLGNSDDSDNITEIASVNKRKFEYLPINFLRGANLENCVVIIDESQNLSKMEAKILLSRMGENVKCICTGDTEQVDKIELNSENNGLNWIVKYFKGQPNYAHIVLKGNRSRGPICDLVHKCWDK